MRAVLGHGAIGRPGAPLYALLVGCRERHPADAAPLLRALAALAEGPRAARRARVSLADAVSGTPCAWSRVETAGAVVPLDHARGAASRSGRTRWSAGGRIAIRGNENGVVRPQRQSQRRCRRRCLPVLCAPRPRSPSRTSPARACRAAREVRRCRALEPLQRPKRDSMMRMKATMTR